MRRFTILVALIHSASCYDPTSVPAEKLVLGTIAFYFQPIIVEVPDTVKEGASVGVLIRTYGGGCERLGPTEVQVHGDSVAISPFEYTRATPGVACTEELRVFDHETSFRAVESGETVVTISGLVQPGATEHLEIRHVIVEPR